MPKEVTVSRVIKTSTVTVGWERHCDAQIGVQVPNQFRFVNKDGTPMEDEGDVTYNSLWFTFTDRSQINEVIRNLQKARDKAFGKDA